MSIYIEDAEIKKTSLNGKHLKMYLDYLSDTMSIDTSYPGLSDESRKFLTEEKRAATLLQSRIRASNEPLDANTLAKLIEQSAKEISGDIYLANGTELKEARDIAAAYQLEKFSQLRWEQSALSDSDNYILVTAREKGITKATQNYLDRCADAACRTSETSPLTRLINGARRRSLDGSILEAYVTAAIQPHKDDLAGDTGLRSLRSQIDAALKGFLERLCKERNVNYSDIIMSTPNRE